MSLGKQNKSNFKYTTNQEKLSKRQQLLISARKTDKVNLKSFKRQPSDERSSIAVSKNSKESSLAKSISKKSCRSYISVKSQIKGTTPTKLKADSQNNIEILKSMFQLLNENRVLQSQRINNKSKNTQSQQRESIEFQKKYFSQNLSLIRATNKSLSRFSTQTQYAQINKTNQQLKKKDFEINMISQCFLNFMEEYLIKIQDIIDSTIVGSVQQDAHSKAESSFSSRANVSRVEIQNKSLKNQLLVRESYSRLKEQQLESLKIEICEIKNKLNSFEEQQNQLQFLTVSNPAITNLFAENTKKGYPYSDNSEQVISSNNSRNASSKVSEVSSMRTYKQSYKSKDDFSVEERQNSLSYRASLISQVVEKKLTAEETLQQIKNILIRNTTNQHSLNSQATASAKFPHESFKKRQTNLSENVKSHHSSQYYEGNQNQQFIIPSRLSKNPQQANLPIVEEPSSSFISQNIMSANNSTSHHKRYFNHQCQTEKENSQIQEIEIETVEFNNILKDKNESLNRKQDNINQLIGKISSKSQIVTMKVDLGKRELQNKKMICHQQSKSKKQLQSKKNSQNKPKSTSPTINKSQLISKYSTKKTIFA